MSGLVSVPNARGSADVVIVGAGAAGLMAGIEAGRAGGGRMIVALDGARRLGAKILVAGGGRCNVTHESVTERDFAGSSSGAIRKVLRRFDASRTVEFFRGIGVPLKREETGKIFPMSDDSHTVLEALLRAAREAGVHLIHPRRVEAVRREGDRFVVSGAGLELRAPRVILATGGRSLPRSGSDGHGWEIARSLGHTTTERIFPALVPLVLAEGSFVRTLAGVAAEATVEVRSPGRRIASFTGGVLCTHFGLSGPAILDASRHFIDAHGRGLRPALRIDWLPGETAASLDARFRNLGSSTPGRLLRGRLPARLVRALCREAGVEPATPGHRLTREARRALVRTVIEAEMPVTGDRGFAHAEATAGGVPLSEIDPRTMASRVCQGLFLCGEICDVDGRIGGFNFQWAWSSGHVAGVSV